MNNTNVNSLTNSGMFPWIWSVACVNGEFHLGTCFAETWLRATNSDGSCDRLGCMSAWADNYDSQATTDDGRTPLYCACEKGHVEIVNALLNQESIDINKTSTEIG